MLSINFNAPILKGIHSTSFISTEREILLFRDLNSVERSWSQDRYADLPDRRLQTFERPVIYGGEGFVQKKDSQFLRDTYWWDEAITEYRLLYNWRTLFRRVLPGNWFSLILYFSWGYYHWVCDVLPRLYKVIDCLPSNTRFIIPKNPSTWILRSLALIGIPEDRCYQFDGKVPISPETLYFASPVAMTGDHYPEALTWVRDEILSRSATTWPPIPTLRLYVSRSAAMGRRLVNEESLMKVLRPLGFQLIRNEQLTLDEQIKLFSKAEWIVGPYGGGLTNMIYAPTGAKIIEIFEPSVLRRCYRQMSYALKHKHYVIVGTNRENLESEPNIFIDERGMESIVKALNNR